ncbi:replication protein [Aneurinibacillus aneurinilyticus]|uniref:replication protein n=1 Tax=Aneurinibacillus aneurinilyticus TaxID=1391 RepID=UPI0035244FFE
MANPQTESGHLRIANEIWDEILRRKFSERQQKILKLIMRLSYGCNKKEAIIPKLNYFEICGVRIQDARKEVQYLADCRIIDWNENTNTFSFNKDYDEWQKDPVRGWDEKKFNELLRMNIVTKSVTELHNNSEVDYEKSKQVTTKSNVIDLRKVEVSNGENPCGSKDEGVSKDILLKTVLKDITDSQEEESVFSFYEKHVYYQIAPNDEQQMKSWLNGTAFDNANTMLIKALKTAIENDADHKWRYANRMLMTWEEQGIRNLEDLKKHEEARENRLAKKQQKGAQPSGPYVPNVDETQEMLEKRGEGPSKALLSDEEIIRKMRERRKVIFGVGRTANSS